MIEVLKEFPDNVVAFACHRQVTQSDYASVFNPAVTKAFKAHDKVRLYYETTADFAGIDPAAAWEDTKAGLAHWRHWERMAVVTDVEWIKRAMKVFIFLMPGELRVFPSAQAAQARDWIAADEVRTPRAASPKRESTLA